MSGQLSLRDFLRVEAFQYGAEEYGWRLWDPRLKLAFCLLAMFLNVFFAQALLSGVLLVIALAFLIYSRSSWRLLLLFLLAPASATFLLVLGMAMGFGIKPVWSWGPFTFYREGIAMGLNAGLRVATDVSWAGLFVITTPFLQILEALRWFRLPKVLLETLSYIYRYVFLLYDEFQAMKAAAQARGGFVSMGSGVKTSGLIAAQIFLRSYDRAERIWGAMRARGAEAQDGF